MATNAQWTVVFDDKLVIKQTGDAAGTSYNINDNTFWSQAELGSPHFARLFDWLFWYLSCTRGLRLGGLGYRRCGSCISGAWHSSGCFHGICLWLAVAY